jgi:hypothetical protein
MVIGIIGENCTGKSTLAEHIQAALGGEIITGKDFLRMAKSEAMAAILFKKKLQAALDGENVIYVITEQEHVKLLPDGAKRILVQADIDTIKARFAERMHGNLPAPVAMMLERKHGIFDSGTYDFVYDGVHDDPAALCEQLK